MREDTEAVSEVIGYVVMVSIVFLTISLVLTNVIPAVTETEQTEQTENAQRVFSVLQQNVEEMIRRNVPSRSTEIQVNDGALSATRDASIINVTIDTGGTIIKRSIGTRRVTYETEAGVISYENGAVFRRNTGGDSAMLKKPAWNVENNGPVILPMISLGGTSKSVSGNTVGLIKTTKSTRIAQYRLDTANATAADEVELNITSPNADAWRRYAEGLEGAQVDSFDDENNKVSIIIDGIGDRTLIYTENVIAVEIK